MLQNIKIVLIETSHPGNIGSTARAMLNMGLTNLCLVSPKKMNKEAIIMASHADEIVKNAQIVNNINEALDGMDFVVGTSARVRKVSLPLLPVSEVAKDVIKRTTQDNQKVAILFGRERTGLFNEEILNCNLHAYISTNKDYNSLNLSQAVQVMAYELYMKYLTSYDKKTIPSQVTHKKATNIEYNGLYKHFYTVLKEIDFLKKEGPKSVMNKIKRLFQRSELESQEVHILRGFLSAIERKIKE